MYKLADPDTAFLIPCVHCDALVAEDQRVCPSCGKDQRTNPNVVVATGSTTIDRGRIGDGLGVRWHSLRETDPLVNDPNPSSFSAERTAARRALPPRILALMAMILIAPAMFFGVSHYKEKRSEERRLQMFEVTLEELRRALDQGDLVAAKRAVDLLDPIGLSHPSVLTLKQNFDHRMLEQRTRREQLNAAALAASQSLGFGQSPLLSEGERASESVAPLGPSPAPAPTPTPTFLKSCNGALAALALCQSN